MKQIILLIGIMTILLIGCAKEDVTILDQNFLTKAAYVVGYQSGNLDMIKAMLEDRPIGEIVCERNLDLNSEFTNYLVKSYNLTC